MTDVFVATMLALVFALCACHSYPIPDMLGATVSADTGPVAHSPQARTQPFVTSGTSYFEPLCTCSGKIANCSHNYGSLTFVPSLPGHIRTLLFSFNNVTAIPKDDFFVNVSQITELDMQSNGLSFISSGAFRRLPKLDMIKLDNNKLTYADIETVFRAGRLNRLFISNMNLGPLPAHFFENKNISNLQSIDLSFNVLTHLNMSVFLPLKHLSRLYASDSHVNSITSDYLPSLEKLSLYSNALYDLPDSCGPAKQSLFPRLRSLILRDNRIRTLNPRVCLPRLNSLDLSINQIHVFQTDMFKERFPALRKLSLHHIPWQAGNRIEPFAFRHPLLGALSLMNNGIPFSDSRVHPDCFAGSPRLGMLQLSHNMITGTGEEKFSRLFGSLPALNRLYLGQCGLQTTTIKTFNQLRSLTTLYLYQNKLVDIPDGAFDSLVNLTELSIYKNQLTTVRKGLFSPDTRRKLEILDLSGNPLSCDCDLLWFKQWFVTTPKLFKHSMRNYSCSNASSEVPLRLFSLAEQACLLSHTTSQLIIACCVIAISLLVVVSALYRYRWYLRLLLAFHTRSVLRRRRRRHADDDDDVNPFFAYDVFVSFASEDLPWVEEHLVPNLEERLGLRLCVHERDFVAGKPILQNIEDCVAASRKILMLFSRDFTRSRWCQYELNLCLRHVYDHEDALLVACLGDVVSRDVTSSMMAVMDTTTYVQWPEGAGARADFWERVQFALRGLLPPRQ